MKNLPTGSPVFEVSNLTIIRSGKKVLDNINFTIRSGEHWMITGASGSGKTTLAETLANYRFHGGHISCPEGLRVSYIEQQHHFRNLSNLNEFYYQQRFQSMDAEDSLTVAEYLETAEHDNKWIQIFGIERLLPKPLIQLSNGENKRVQMVTALVETPDVMILDNPFIGLDKEGRAILHKGLKELAESGIQIILVTDEKEKPDFVTHTFRLPDPENATTPKAAELPSGLPPMQVDFGIAVKMENVSVRYGNNIILNNINWTVNAGEKWLVSGPNGSGKSTLLSLITGDNPQAYANHITLFDKKRGTGESIWDIKRRIGFVSPEIHLNFDRFNLAHEVIGSGFFDTIGLFRPLSEDQLHLIRSWMEIAGIGEYFSKPMISLPLGVQRLILILRAMVKNPPLLILDEPLQGLDQKQRENVLHLTDLFCLQEQTTLIYVSHYADEIPGCITRFFDFAKS